MSASETAVKVHLDGEVRRIVVERPLFLGDLLMTVPAFRALRRRFPGAEISLIGLPWASEFVRHVPNLLDRFLEFPGWRGIPEVTYVRARTERFLEEQRAYGYDLAVQMHGNGSYINGFIARLGARVTLGFALRGDGRLTISAPQVLRGRELNEVHNWLRLVGMIGARTEDTSLEFHTLAEDERAADGLLAEVPEGRGPLVGIHPGAKEEIRRWPPERFARLADRLASELGARVVLTGSEEERDITEGVAGSARAPVTDLTGRTDLGTLAAMISRLDLLVTNDSGPSHLAAATRTPSVVLFGPTRPWQFAPLDRQLHRVVDATDFVAPGVPGELALSRLPVEPVVGACLEMIRTRATRGVAASPEIVGGGISA